MAVNPLLNSVSVALAQQSAPALVRAPVAVANSNAPSASTSDSTPSQSVLQTAGLLNVSSNFAQLGSLLEVAQSGTQQIVSILQQLQTLADQVPASGDLTGIDSEFSQLLSQINGVASGTTFNGSSLLDGTFSGDAQGAIPLSLPDLTTQGLFGQNPPDLSNLQAATTALSQALGTADTSSANISNVQTQLGFASASVDSALANSTAASSTLSESDLAGGIIPALTAEFLNNPATASQAQTGNLSDNLLSLLQE